MRSGSSCHALDVSHLRQRCWLRRIVAADQNRRQSAQPVQPDRPRHEHASTVLPSNKGFEEWGLGLGDDVMAAALIDRLLHHGHIVNIRGNSYRMPAHQNLLRQNRSDDDVRSAA